MTYFEVLDGPACGTPGAEKGGPVNMKSLKSSALVPDPEGARKPDRKKERFGRVHNVSYTGNW
jgi:hypothetical protein